MVGRLTLDQVVKVRVLAPQLPRVADVSATRTGGSRRVLAVILPLTLGRRAAEADAFVECSF
jgi:hypothetical protein